MLLKLHLHPRLIIWLQWTEQRQLQDETRNIQVLGFGTSYIRGCHTCFHTQILSSLCCYLCWQHQLGLLYLTHWGLDKMAATLADDLFKCISLNKNFWILNKIPLKYATYGLIGSIGSALVQIMARRRIGDKPISEALSVCCTDAYMRHWASMSYIIYNIHCSKTFKHAHLLHVFIVHLLIFTLNIVLNQTNTVWEDNHRLSLETISGRN